MSKRLVWVQADKTREAAERARLLAERDDDATNEGLFREYAATLQIDPAVKPPVRTHALEEAVYEVTDEDEEELWEAWQRYSGV